MSQKAVVPATGERRQKLSMKKDIGKTPSVSSSQTSSAPSFSIFDENQPAVLEDNASSITSRTEGRKKKPSFKTASSSSSSSSSSSLDMELSKSRELIDPIPMKLSARVVGNKHGLSFQADEFVSEFDVEDSTINTKLARHDIDSMFFSPSGKEDKLLKMKSTVPTNGHVREAAEATFRPPTSFPLGMKVEELTGIKDLSAIREVCPLCPSIIFHCLTMIVVDRLVMKTRYCSEATFSRRHRRSSAPRELPLLSEVPRTFRCITLITALRGTLSEETPSAPDSSLPGDATLAVLLVIILTRNSLSLQATSGSVFAVFEHR